MNRPPGADVLPEATARVLAALWRVYARDGRATVATVADEAGRSRGNVHGRLCDLARLGLVAGIGDGYATNGTLRPLVWPVPIYAAGIASAIR